MNPKSITTVRSITRIGIVAALLAAGIVTAGAGAPPQRQEIIQLQADVVNLEQRVIEIQRSLDERNAALQSLVEQMSDTVGTLSSSVERILSVMDQVQAGNERLSAELRVSMGNLADDVERMDQSIDEVRSSVSALSQQMTALSATSQELGAPDNVLRNADVDYGAGRWELAREGYLDFIATFPTSPDAAFAQMRLGDIERARNEFELSIIEYDLLLQKYPGSDRTTEALFKKGLSLVDLGQPSDARDVFRQIVSDYPGTAQAVRAEEELNLLDN